MENFSSRQTIAGQPIFVLVKIYFAKVAIIFNNFVVAKNFIFCVIRFKPSVNTVFIMFRIVRDCISALKKKRYCVCAGLAKCTAAKLNNRNNFKIFQNNFSARFINIFIRQNADGQNNGSNTTAF